MSNILDFGQRYSPVATFRIEVNRRSRPQIVQAANRVSQTIAARLPKSMLPHRLAAGNIPQVVQWNDENEGGEAGWITNMIIDLNEQGVRFRDMAVLARSPAVFPRLILSPDSPRSLRLLDLQVAGRSSKTVGWYEQKIRYYLQSVVSARAGFALPQAPWPPTSSRSRRLG